MKKLLLGLVFACVTTQAHTKPYLDIQEIETPRGLHVWFVQDKTVPVMALKFALKGGAQLDPPGKDGTTELMSSLFDEGAGKRDAEAFQNALDANSVRMGFTATRDDFAGSLKTTMQNSVVAFELFDDALNRTHFAPEAVDRMKQAMQSNMRFMRMNPDWMASTTLFSRVFAGQAYARQTEGTPETLPKITIEDLKQTKKELFCRDRLTLSVVGAMEAKDVAALADRVFGAWPKCAKPIDETPLVMKAKGEAINMPWQGAQTSVMMVQAGLSRQNKDWWAARILDFALGGGQFSSRLMDEVRVKRSLTYGIYSSLVPYDLAPLWVVQAGVDPSKTAEAISVSKKIWADVAANGLTDAEINAAKSYLIGSLPLALTSTDKIAAILLQLQQDKLPKNTLDVREAEINAVTAADIKRVAHEYLDAKNLTIVTVGPEKKK